MKIFITHTGNSLKIGDQTATIPVPLLYQGKGTLTSLISCENKMIKKTVL